jgi:peptide/nickel transport system substrate-binding protein
VVCLSINKHIPLFFLFFVLIATVGCGTDTTSITTGRTMVLSTTSPPKSFNPVVAKETSTTDITSKMFVGLTTRDGVTGEVEPELAKDWTSSEGGRVWTFTLRDGLHWSDGEPITARDVKFTYDRLYLNPDVTASARFMLLMDGEPPEVSVLSDTRIRFRYPQPYAPFARVASLAIMPEHKLRGKVESGDFNSAWGVGTEPDSLVVNGPFELERYRTNQRVILRRNDRYYETTADGDSLPRLNRLLYEVVQNREVSFQKFKRGTIDVLSLQGKDYPLLKPREEELDFTIHRVGASLGTTFLSFNMNTDTAPETGETHIPRHKLRWFNDPAFRRAVSYGMDREQIINIVMNGLGVATYGPLSPANKPFYREDLREYRHDSRRARRILRENGYRDRDGDGIREGPDGHRVEFVLNTNSGNGQRVEMTEIIRQDLANLGFDVNFSQVEFNTLVNKLNNSYDWEAVVIGFTGSIDPHFGSNLWRSSGDLHILHPRQKRPHREWEAEIDRIFQQAVRETDRDRRRELYDRWQGIVNRVQPVVFTVTPETMFAVRDRFTHVNPTPIGGFSHNIERIGVNE